MVSYWLAKNLVKLAIAQDNYIQLLEARGTYSKEGEPLRNQIDYCKYLVDWKGNYVKKI